MRNALSVLGGGLCLGVLSAALSPSVGLARTFTVHDCSAPVVAGAGDKVNVVQNVTCSAADVEGWGGATSFITLKSGARLKMLSRSITLSSSVSRAVTAVSVEGDGVSVDGGPPLFGTLRGFARGLSIEGDHNSVRNIVVDGSRLRALPIGSAGKDAHAAVVISNGSQNSLDGLAVTGTSIASGSQSLFSAALAVWGDQPGATTGNELKGIALLGNTLASTQGEAPAALPAPGEAPPAPPGPPTISDPTPNGGGVGQTLTTVLLVLGSSPGTNTANLFDGIEVAGNRISTQSTTTASLSGLVSFESALGNVVENVHIALNDVVAVTNGESQAGFVALTESDANDLGNLVIEGNMARAGRASGGVVVAVGKSNAIHDVSLEGNAFKAGSFTGGVFFYGELAPQNRTTGGNVVSDIEVKSNFFQSQIGNASVFLFSAFANNFSDIRVSSNTYVFFGFDVWDFGIFGTTDCSPVPFSPAFVPFPLPPLNHWENIQAAVVQPACI